MTFNLNDVMEDYSMEDDWAKSKGSKKRHKDNDEFVASFY